MNYFYGGAFNPMTIAHLQIICAIEQQMMKDCDTLIIGITNHDYKQYKYDYQLRKKIVFENLKVRPFCTRRRHTPIDIKIVEQNQRTWKFLTEDPSVCWRRPLTIVLGEDEYKDLIGLKTWHYSQEILDNFPIKTFSRSNETKDISATKVRELLQQNCDGDDYSQLQKYITHITYDILIKEEQKKNEQI